MGAAFATAGGQQSTGDFFLSLGVVAAVAFLVWFLNRVMMHFFPQKYSPRTTMGNALMRVEATFLPGREHVVHAIERDNAEQDETGEPPASGYASHEKAQ